MNNSLKFVKGGRGGICLVIFVLASLMFSSCGGGGSGTNEPAVTNLSVDWVATDGASASFAAYSNSITAKASIDGGTSVDGTYSSGIYSFTFSDVTDGDHTLTLEFYYSGNKIGSAEVTAALKGGEAVNISLSAADIKFEGDFANATDAVMDVAASDSVDLDADGLSDKKEKELGTDPTNPDTDGDSIPDGVEVSSGLDPLKADTDGDGANDLH